MADEKIIHDPVYGGMRLRGPVLDLVDVPEVQRLRRIHQLGLANASAIKARAEDYAPAEGFDTVIARALSSIPKLLELAGQLVGEEGVLLALKGQHPADELEPVKELSGWKYEVTDVTVPGLESHARHVVCLRRTNTA